MNTAEKRKIYVPGITDVISLSIPLQVRVSPDGTKVAYTCRSTDWSKNVYEATCFVYDRKSGARTRLTRNGSAEQLRWVDSERIAVLKTEAGSGEKQVWLFEHTCGEPVQVTRHKGGVHSFEPFAGGIVYLADCPKRRERKERSDKFGNVVHFENEPSASALYYTSFDLLERYFQEQKSVERSEEVLEPVIELSTLLSSPEKIVDFCVSPNQRDIYVNCQIRDDLVYMAETSVYRIRLDARQAVLDHIAADAQQRNDKRSFKADIRKMLLPKGAACQAISPNGSRIAVRYKQRDQRLYTQHDLFILDMAQVMDKLDSEPLAPYLQQVTGKLDRAVLNVCWTRAGLYVGFANGTAIDIARLTEDGDVQMLDFGKIKPWNASFCVSDDADVGFVGASPSVYPEVFISSQAPGSLDQVTSLGKSVEGWDFGSVETIRWKSRDGAEIEGVLRKPSGFDPKKKYPLVFVVHGGPTGCSFEYLFERVDIEYYPGVQFAAQDVLVLKPNYRGSSGYGQEFMELNRDNLGVGDLWDIESAIDYLDSQGYVDLAKVGCMGWSQGGYISAFVGTHSDRFKAVSVGAGISSWYTYHISNDIPQFTTDYLSGAPFENADTYQKTSPMSAIQRAKTPTLIQHGSKDQRVPVSCATELYRALKHKNVPVELFLYPDMAHPITKPRENRAVMQQNLTWFCHWLLDKELDFEI